MTDTTIEQLDAFAGAPTASQGAERTHERVSVAPHPSERLEAFARSAIRTDDAERLRTLAKRVAEIRLEFDGGFFAYQLALDLAKVGLIDGTESRDGWGSIGFDLPAKATKEYHRVPTELPAEYLRLSDGSPVPEVRIAAMERIIASSHSNRCTRWRQMTPGERSDALERQSRKKGRAA